MNTPSASTFNRKDWMMRKHSHAKTSARRARRRTPVLDPQGTISDAAVTARCALGLQRFAEMTGLPESYWTGVLQSDKDPRATLDAHLSRIGNRVLAEFAGMTPEDFEQRLDDDLEIVGATPDPRLVHALIDLGYVRVVAAT